VISEGSRGLGDATRRKFEAWRVDPGQLGPSVAIHHHFFYTNSATTSTILYDRLPTAVHPQPPWRAHGDRPA
jgi:hypothetical protein